MKLVRFSWKETGQRVWVLQHDLCSRLGPVEKTRPIHVLTYVYNVVGHLLDPEGGPERSTLSAALEAKLTGVALFGRAMAEAFDRIPDPSGASDVASWNGGAAFLATLEAYLNTIYSCLEVAKHLAKTLAGELKRDLPWQLSFYDVRTELCHYGSSLPDRRGSVHLEITQGRPRLYEEGKRAEIPVRALLAYEDGLRDLLDEWARERLAALDPELKFRQLVFSADGTQREGHDITLRELMATHL